jgi:hypothetical protein
LLTTKGAKATKVMDDRWLQPIRLTPFVFVNVAFFVVDITLGD